MTTELSPLNYVEQERLDALERFTVALALGELLQDAPGNTSVSVRCQSIIAKLGLAADMEDIAKIIATFGRLRKYADVQFVTADDEVPFE